MTCGFDVVETGIADLRAALEKGETTAVELLDAYLARIDAYDRPGTATALNAMVVMNPHARAEAEASDARRARGETSARWTASRTPRRTATSPRD
ncbi:hypothetical protein O1L55_05030 [Streptomyces albulus]|nr:hypothetical protein [Streptomyces noursei]